MNFLRELNALITRLISGAMAYFIAVSLAIFSSLSPVAASEAEAADPFGLVETCAAWVRVQQNGPSSTDEFVQSLSCQFYVSGFFDGYAINDEYSYSDARPQEFSICFPDAVAIGDIIQGFVRYTKSKDTRGGAGPDGILFSAMVAQFPCKD